VFFTWSFFDRLSCPAYASFGYGASRNHPKLKAFNRLIAMTKMRCHLYHSLRLARDERWASGYRRDITSDNGAWTAVRTPRQAGEDDTQAAQIIDLRGYRRISN
jgi:hypothetical protein